MSMVAMLGLTTGAS